MIRDNHNEFSRRATEAMKRTRQVVVERARQHGTPVVTWRDGKVVELDPFSDEFSDVSDSPRKTDER
jgi:hypothetical protein